MPAHVVSIYLGGDAHTKEDAETIAKALRQLFGLTVVVSDDPDAIRVLRGFAMTERQDDPEREAERLAAMFARSMLAHEGEGVPTR